jgi:tetratricopeptide (TPR) repeat protein
MGASPQTPGLAALEICKIRSAVLTADRRRMFKQRVADWKLYKNYKDAERVEVTRKVKELERQGRGQSQLFIHMRPAKTQRVARKDSHGQALVARSPPKHREEKKSLPKIAGREGIIDGDLLKRVVMNSSPFRPLSTLPELKDAEMILLHTNIYYDTFSSLGGIVDYPTPHSTISRTHPYALGNKIDTAFKYLKSDQQVAAWRLLNEASDMAKALFTEPHYKLLQIIILEAADWSSNAPTDVYKSYYMFLARMASVILGEGNPISIILSSFTRLSPADRAHEVIYQLALTKIEERLGIDHPDTIEATDQYHTVLGLCGSFEEAEKRQMIQVARLDAVNKYSLNALWALYSLGVTRKDMGDYDGAIIALSDVRDRMRLVVDAGTNRFSYNSVEISAIQELSVSFNAKGMYEETRRVTEETLGRCLGNTEWNRGEWQTTAIVAELHNAYMKLGMLDEADELKRRYPENF